RKRSDAIRHPGVPRGASTVRATLGATGVRSGAASTTTDRGNPTSSAIGSLRHVALHPPDHLPIVRSVLACPDRGVPRRTDRAARRVAPADRRRRPLLLEHAL